MKHLYLFFFFFSAILFSQSQNDTTDLKEVVIKADSEIQSDFQSDANVSLLNRQDILRGDQSIITPILNQIPGVYMQQGGLNTNKINIRGIGARAQYETNRLKLYYDNIPLTTANGTSTLDDIDLTNISNIKVIKGPQATEFGAGLGGVIQLKSNLPKKETINSGLIFGSFDYLKQNYSLSQATEDKQIYLSYNNLSSGGFRENSEYQRESYFLNSKWKLSENSDLQFLGQFTSMKGFIPSSLSRTDFENNPESAAFTWAQAKGYESYDSGTFGLNWSQHYDEFYTQNTSVFMNFRDAYEPRPFDILEDQNIGFGIRHVGGVQFSLFEKAAEIKLGGEFMKDDYDVSTFENLYEQNNNQGSLQGEKISDLKQNRQYLELFSTLKIELNSRWNFKFGLATNKTKYEISDRFSTGENAQNGNYDYDRVWLPNFVSQYQFSDNHKISASISRGFSVPTLEQSLTEEGVFNTNLKPEKAWNYEVGYQSKWFGSQLLAEVNAYYMNVENLLVARRVDEDRFVGINAGSTIHPGIEFSFKSNLDLDESLQIQPYFSGNFNFYEFDTFVDGDDNFSGNDLTGVPDRQLNFGLDAVIFNRLYLFFQTNAVSEIPLKDANTEFTESYAFSNLKLDYRFIIFKEIQVSLSAGVNNMFNEKYAASIVTNAVGFGGSEPRYFYPGQGRNYFGGFRLSYNF
ncbi:TonB-dependent receptor family protein [Psychroflexus aestuariivivens]|uniref:TonB-dependent receptor family protein n=1 Tax=Psychroflexus aestuariivivens TaxID=1795040 RepID=UPI000FDCC8AE|nr:TonB-dependent receptor [Psychroflexus aestuariivivens]